MGIIQAADDKEVLEAWDFSKPQNNCKSSNMSPAYKSTYKENIQHCLKQMPASRISTDAAVYGTEDFIMDFWVKLNTTACLPGASSLPPGISKIRNTDREMNNYLIT